MISKLAAIFILQANNEKRKKHADQLNSSAEVVILNKVVIVFVSLPKCLLLSHRFCFRYFLGTVYH